VQIAIKAVKVKMHTDICLVSIHPEDLRKCHAVTAELRRERRKVQRCLIYGIPRKIPCREF